MTTSTADNPTWVPPTWDEVVREHADRVYRLAYRLSGNRADAEDLTQETFVRVFRSLSQYSPGTFEGWLHRITTNLFLDLVRRRQRIRFDALPEDADDRLAGAQPGPEQTYDEMHLDPEIQAALDALPPDFRVAVVLCDLEQLSYEEIAATLGIKVGTVRSRIHRGRVLLREALAHRAPGVRPVEPQSALTVATASEAVGAWNVQHLSDEAVAAFADGVLGGHARERAGRHVDECAECRTAVRVQREAAIVLRAAPSPALPTDLLARLRSVPQNTPITSLPTALTPDGTAVLATRAMPASALSAPLVGFVPTSMSSAAPMSTAPMSTALRAKPFVTAVAVAALAGALTAGSVASQAQTSTGTGATFVSDSNVPRGGTTPDIVPVNVVRELPR